MAHKLRGEEIERLMLLNGFNKTKLAKASRVSIRSLNRWIDGKPASLDGLLLLAKALGANPDALRADKKKVKIETHEKNNELIVSVQIVCEVAISKAKADSSEAIKMLELLKSKMPDKQGIKLIRMDDTSVIFSSPCTEANMAFIKNHGDRLLDPAYDP